MMAAGSEASGEGVSCWSCWSLQRARVRMPGLQPWGMGWAWQARSLARLKQPLTLAAAYLESLDVGGLRPTHSAMVFAPQPAPAEAMVNISPGNQFGHKP